MSESDVLFVKSQEIDRLLALIWLWFQYPVVFKHQDFGDSLFWSQFWYWWNDLRPTMQKRYMHSIPLIVWNFDLWHCVYLYNIVVRLNDAKRAINVDRAAAAILRYVRLLITTISNHASWTNPDPYIAITGLVKYSALGRVGELLYSLTLSWCSAWTEPSANALTGKQLCQTHSRHLEKTGAFARVAERAARVAADINSPLPSSKPTPTVHGGWQIVPAQLLTEADMTEVHFRMGSIREGYWFILVPS